MKTSKVSEVKLALADIRRGVDRLYEVAQAYHNDPDYVDPRLVLGIISGLIDIVDEEKTIVKDIDALEKQGSLSSRSRKYLQAAKRSNHKLIAGMVRTANSMERQRQKIERLKRG